jgi:hypothetical protein
MTTIREIEKAVTQLPHDDFNKFRAWFEEFDAKQWDVQFEKDAKTGKLDLVAEKAISDYKKGKCSKL